MARSKREAQPLRRSARIASKPKPLPKPPSICKPCRKGPFAAQLGIFRPEGYSYPVRRSQINQRASFGCVWCEFLRDYLFPSLPSARAKPERCLNITLKLAKLWIAESIDAQLLSVSAAASDIKPEPVYMWLTTSSADPAAPYITARDPILDVGSSRALSLAKELIDECVHGHEGCKQISPSSDVRLPTRLLDCTDPASPRLVSTEGRRGEYIALSYVWGEAQPHKTTNANQAVYSAGIDPSLLPQTILDAIYVTHTLGFRYLWVDSLCIIQDSGEDKLHEIGRMHLIYRHAYLTIIAACAKRASDGFLQDRPAPLHGITLPFICPPHRLIPGDKLARGTQPVAEGEVHLSAFHEMVGGPYLKEPVDRRGWCLQELLMSSRALIFASTTLRFRCPNGIFNVGDSRYAIGKIDGVRLPDIVLHPAPLFIQLGSNEWHHTHAGWASIVQEYSGRTLGKASDKLVACGALAEAFHRILGCDYLAGLWRDTLFEDLLWASRRHERGYVADRPAKYRAPSWSWAAVDGKIISRLLCYPDDDLSVVLSARVVRCDVTLKNPELPFGEVTGGSLVLRAKLIPCKVCRADNGWGAGILLPPLPSGQCPGGSDHADEARTVAERETLYEQHCYVDHLSDLLIERDLHWLLPFWWKGDDTCSWRAVEGLILTLANPESGSGLENRQTYRRIGAFMGRRRFSKRLRHRFSLEEEKEVEIV